MKTTPHHTTYITRVLPMFALLMLSSHAVFAQIGSTQWTGSTSTDFYDGTNWANGQYPNGNTTFVDSALTGAANTTVDRAPGGNYIFGLYFNNTLGTDNSYTINGPQGFAIGGSVIRTAEVTSGSLTDVINADIADTGTADVWDIRTNHHLDMNGVYSGSNTTTKIGDGILTFAGANTYTGATFVNAGTLKVTNSSNTPSYTIASGATLDLSSSITANTAISGGGTLNITGSVWANSQSLTTQMDSGAYIDITAGSTLGFNGGNDAWTGNLADVNVDGLLRGAANNFEIDALTGSGEVQMSSGTIVLGVDGGGGTFSGTFNDSYGPDGYLRKEGSGTQELTGAIDLGTGSTVTVNGGTLKIANSSTASSYNIASGATLELSSGASLTANTTFTGTGTLNVVGNISLSSIGATFSMGSGAYIDVKSGGRIVSNGGNDPWTGSLADVNVDGWLYVANNNLNADVLTGSGLLEMGNNTINLGVDNGTGGVFNGNIRRSYANAHLDKQGTGTQTLNGEVNLGSTGTVTVSEGTLIFNGTSSGTNATGSWIVQNGATLSGSGTLSGTATIGDGATLSPGNSPGTQTFDNLTWVNGGTYLWEINADLASGGDEGVDSGWDWIDVTNTFDLSGITTGFNIDITSLTTGNIAGLADGFDYSGKSYLDPYESFTILSFGSLTGDFDASEFNLLTGNFANPKVDWSLELSGNDLVLNAVFVPEPSSTALLGLGGLALMLRRKRS